MLSNKWIISMISTKYLFNSGTSLWFNRTWMNGLKEMSLSQGLLLCLTLSFSLGDGIYLQQKSKAFFLLFFIFLIPLAVNQQVFNWAQYESISIWNFKVTDHQVQISSQCFSSHHIIFFFFLLSSTQPLLDRSCYLRKHLPCWINFLRKFCVESEPLAPMVPIQ